MSNIDGIEKFRRHTTFFCLRLTKLYCTPVVSACIVSQDGTNIVAEIQSALFLFYLHVFK